MHQVLGVEAAVQWELRDVGGLRGGVGWSTRKVGEERKEAGENVHGGRWRENERRIHRETDTHTYTQKE